MIVPPHVRGKALALGAAGRAWLDGLAAAVAELAAEWSIAVEDVLHGGSEALVARATTADREPVVLKLALPSVPVAHEIAVLRCAGGRGYARLLRSDAARGALLLERLGPSLAELNLPVERQIDVVCATLGQGWAVRCAAPAQTGAEKAAWLAGFIASTWEALGRPASERVVERARVHAQACERAFDPAAAVLVHGDAHATNTLRDPHRPGAFKLVDPDGLLAEPACDLAVPMREWSRQLLDARDVTAAAEERCRRLSRLTGVAAAPIWRWGFMERVSSGLLLLSLGREREGRPMLEVAEAIVGGGGGLGERTSRHRRPGG